ncbi:ester cyclase [Devosia nitrariae]|uniref:Cyclase n=1 Tax=Devosia nitrariae TaxID=2071872 RepID=A0ABQ5W1J9_9HYPH|nr:ester cyclase [Devosia nitrariae]GLQ53718.1 cyclase [Devosia nitrariae]
MSTMSQTRHSVQDVVTRQIDALNRHDVETLGATYGAGASVWDPQYPELLKGRDAIVTDYTEFLAGFPDLQVTVKRTVEQGNDYAVEFSMTGTHKGNLITPTGQIPATNKRIEIAGCVMGQIDDEGRIVDERRYFDFAGMLGQLGLLE